jgi:hypothetical protein
MISLNGQVSRHVTVKGGGHLLSIYWTADSAGWFTASESTMGTTLLRVDLQGATHSIWELKSNTVAYVAKSSIYS